MKSVRSLAAAAQLQDGKLLVTGGVDGSGSDLNSVDLGFGKKCQGFG
jgi:hypothetical protein